MEDGLALARELRSKISEPIIVARCRTVTENPIFLKLLSWYVRAAYYDRVDSDAAARMYLEIQIFTPEPSPKDRSKIDHNRDILLPSMLEAPKKRSECNVLQNWSPQGVLQRWNPKLEGLKN